jgi:late embryogenesis abundant protein
MSCVQRRVILVAFPILLGLGLGCASLGSLSRIVQPPRFEEAENRPAEVRLAGPSVNRPLGGATVRLWTRVTNPNPFGLRLSTLQTTLTLEGNRAASGDFSLGLPLGAREETVVPLDLSIDFADVAELSRAVRSAVDGRAVEYELEGTIGVDAGALGEPRFGPMTLLRGSLGPR